MASLFLVFFLFPDRSPRVGKGDKRLSSYWYESCYFLKEAGGPVVLVLNV